MTSIPSANILAHRGLWNEPEDANSDGALMGALALGLGIETDIRDSGGVLVVSHDPPSRPCSSVENLLREWTDSGVLEDQTLALNVKSDGLLGLLKYINPLLEKIDHYFFDMSFPQYRSYSLAGLPTAARISEFEPPSDAGVQWINPDRRYWLDGFESDWWLEDPRIVHVCETSKVTLVSPEIHGRDPRAAWDWTVQMLERGFDLSICTDRPIELIKGDW